MIKDKTDDYFKFIDFTLPVFKKLEKFLLKKCKDDLERISFIVGFLADTASFVAGDPETALFLMDLASSRISGQYKPAPELKVAFKNKKINISHNEEKKNNK